MDIPRTSTNIPLKPTSLFLSNQKIGEVGNTSQLHLQKFLNRNVIFYLESVRLHTYSKLFTSPQKKENYPVWNGKQFINSEKSKSERELDYI